MDLLTYLENYDPHELVHVSGDVYCTKTHDSLRISNGKWCWYSRDIGGRSALDYLIKVKGYSFLDAVEHIMGRAATAPPVSLPAQKKRKSSLRSLPHIRTPIRSFVISKQGELKKALYAFALKRRACMKARPTTTSSLSALTGTGISGTGCCAEQTTAASWATRTAATSTSLSPFPRESKAAAFISLRAAWTCSPTRACACLTERIGRLKPAFPLRRLPSEEIH